MYRGNFAGVFSLTIANFSVIGYYLHYANSSPLNLRQYRFVSEEMKQKAHGQTLRYLL